MSNTAEASVSARTHRAPAFAVLLVTVPLAGIVGMVMGFGLRGPNGWSMVSEGVHDFMCQGEGEGEGEGAVPGSFGAGE